MSRSTLPVQEGQLCRATEETVKVNSAGTEVNSASTEETVNSASTEETSSHRLNLPIVSNALICHLIYIDVEL